MKDYTEKLLIRLRMHFNNIERVSDTKTARAFLRNLIDYNKGKILTVTSKSTHLALGGGFVFSRTPEGNEFWCQVYDMLTSRNL